MTPLCRHAPTLKHTSDPTRQPQSKPKPTVAPKPTSCCSKKSDSPTVVSAVASPNGACCSAEANGTGSNGCCSSGNDSGGSEDLEAGGLATVVVVGAALVLGFVLARKFL
jgi:hypothetical protein